MKVSKSIVLWLISVCAVIFTLVIVGGVTRLTESGLSMVEWKPLLGWIPPMNEGQWLEVFEKYKAYPQYQKVNTGMSLSEFKYIFFWEYFHRVLGRLVGMVFFIPYIYFLIRKTIPSGLNKKLLVAFALGGAQGLLGWFMVKSGLVDDTKVSHYRLAAHLSLAFFLFSYLVWIIQDLVFAKSKTAPKDIKPKRHLLLKRFNMGLIVLIALQIIYGAFTAGLRAGYGYNTFPKMGATWIPAGFFYLEPTWLNFFQNNPSVQFIHRTLGWLVLFGVMVFWFLIRGYKIKGRSLLAGQLLAVMVMVQFLLGVFTLIKVIPIGLAVTHQAGALVLLSLSLFSLHSLNKDLQVSGTATN